MKNKALKALQPLIGEWEYSLHNAWFLESMDTEVKGFTTIERLHDSFVMLRNTDADGKPDDIWVFGYSDSQAKYQMFYYDQRGTARIFDMTFDGKEWKLLREDKDFYQKMTAKVSKNKIESSVWASEDKGKTWKKDFDMTYTRIKGSKA